MMSWVQINPDGLKQITCYNRHGTLVASITEETDVWVFDFGVSQPGELKISKTDLVDPTNWLASYIGMDIPEPAEADPVFEAPFLTFVDDESKAVWQVWDVVEGGS